VFEFAFNKRFVDDHLGRNVSEFTFLPSLHLFAHRLEVPLMRSTPTEMQSMSENDFDGFASTGVNTPETMFP
jgi:hypothetical protein